MVDLLVACTLYMTSARHDCKEVWHYNRSTCAYIQAYEKETGDEDFYWQDYRECKIEANTEYSECMAEVTKEEVCD